MDDDEEGMEALKHALQGSIAAASADCGGFVGFWELHEAMVKARSTDARLVAQHILQAKLRERDALLRLAEVKDPLRDEDGFTRWLVTRQEWVQGVVFVVIGLWALRWRLAVLCGVAWLLSHL